MSKLIDVFCIPPELIVKMSGFQLNAIERLSDIWTFKRVGDSQFSAGVVFLFETEKTFLTVATNGVVQTTPKPIWTINRDAETN